MKIVTIVGARPQFVKSAPVSKALKESGIEEVVVHTGQHFDANMSAIFFEEMQMAEPAYHLGIHGGTHAQMTGAMMEALEKTLKNETPDAVLVYGDTNSTLAGALCAAKANIPLVHVESGLRSFNRRMPEEINRIITDSLSSVLFCPTPLAVENLEKEGKRHSPGLTVELCGDVMFDALLHFSKISQNKSKTMERLNLSATPFVLVTLHRQENTDDEQRLQAIVKALKELSKERKVVFPVHPRTAGRLGETLKHENILAIEPVGYLDMLTLLRECSLVVTDSGGLQKEAFMMKKFCVTCREETEWQELVEANVNSLCGADPDKIRMAAQYYFDKPFPSLPSFYGNGTAANQIALTLQAKFNSR